jgi:hypothetical protein
MFDFYLTHALPFFNRDLARGTTQNVHSDAEGLYIHPIASGLLLDDNI